MSFRSAARQRAFTLIELLVVILIIAILIAVAAPSFLGQQDKAHDSAAKQTLTVSQKAAKAIWTSEGQDGYPGTGSDATELIDMLGDAEPQYTYAAGEEAAADGVVSVTREGADSVGMCLVSKSDSTFCLRTDEKGSFVIADAGSWADKLLGVEAAHAAGTTVAYATGSTEAAARCELSKLAGETEECAASLGTARLGWEDPVRGAGDENTEGDSDEDTEPLPTPDTTAPDTTIESGPTSNTTNTTAQVAFSATEAATFECKLDTGSWEPCVSPKAYSGLSVGEHTVSVRATDTAGNRDDSEASHTWTVRALSLTEKATSGAGLWDFGAASSFPVANSLTGAKLAGAASKFSGTVNLGATGPDSVKAAQFAGGVVTIPDAPETSPTGSFTVQAWVRLTGNGLTYKHIVEKYDTNGFELLVNPNRSNNPACGSNTKGGFSAPRFRVFGSGGTAAACSQTSLVAATDNAPWYHLAGVYAKGSGGAPNQVQIYINGELKDTQTTAVVPGDSAGPMYVGGYGNDGREPLNSWISSVSLLNGVAASAADIKAEYDRGPSGVSTP